jgi:murein L,D-transpeptidase YafK
VTAALAAGLGLLVMNAPIEDRVALARAEKEAALISLCKSLGFAGLPKRLYIRVFKEEKLLETWGYNPKTQKYTLVRTYNIAAASGTVGPKRESGDGQVPEGFYRVSAFNPQSRFHLSLRVNYPNQADLKFTAPDPGGDIYIHGNRVSIGCMAMTDDKIKEIYLLALAAKGNSIPVHIFPAKLTAPNLSRLIARHPAHGGLWKSMKPMFDEFEKHRRVPAVRIEKNGQYTVVAPRE